MGGLPRLSLSRVQGPLLLLGVNPYSSPSFFVQLFASVCHLAHTLRSSRLLWKPGALPPRPQEVFFVAFRFRVCLSAIPQCVPRVPFVATTATRDARYMGYAYLAGRLLDYIV